MTNSDENDSFLSEEKPSDFKGLGVPKYRIGTGCYGVVYKCLSSKKDEWFAIKVCTKKGVENEKEKEKFERENSTLQGLAKSLQALGHENVVKYIEYMDYSTTRYIVLELMDGCFKSLMESPVEWFFNDPIAASILLQIINGLAFLHGKGVMHRDVKPSNVLYSVNGDIKLGDFGSCKDLYKDSCQYVPITHSHQPGAEFYSAPEVRVPVNDVGCLYNEKCDIWSAGVTLLTIKIKDRCQESDDVIALLENEMGDLYIMQIVHDKMLLTDPEERNTAEEISIKITDYLNELNPNKVVKEWLGIFPEVIHNKYNLEWS